MKTVKKICIIGGGWYGCRIAKLLAEEQKYQVTLYERNKELMESSSGYNSFRLHRGPHYPRDVNTRQQVHQSFYQFCEGYPDFVIDQFKAWYAIGDIDSDNNKSLTSVDEFYRVCHETDPCWKIEDPTEYGITNVQTLVCVNEKTVSVDKPKPYFNRVLRDLGVVVKLGCTVVTLEKSKIRPGVLVEVLEDDKRSNTKQEFDFLINCTYYTEFTNGTGNEEKVYYEPCITFYYKPKVRFFENNLISLSIFDGMFPSLDPYITNRHSLNDEINSDVLYILTHAKYTPFGQYKSVLDARNYLENLCKDEIDERKWKMENHFSHYYKNFYQHFDYVGHFVSIKTKLESKTSFCGACVWKDKDLNMLNVFSGKINTIFQAGDSVANYLREFFLNAETVL